MINAYEIPSPPRGERVRVRGIATTHFQIVPLTPALSPNGGEGGAIAHAS